MECIVREIRCKFWEKKNVTHRHNAGLEETLSVCNASLTNRVSYVCMYIYIYMYALHFQTSQREILRAKAKMKCVMVTVFFLTLAFSVSKGMDAEKESPTYFILAMHWPISLCNAGQLCTKKLNSHLLTSFTIHGLWPFNANGELMQYCSTAEVFANSKVCLLRTLIIICVH